MLKILKSKSDLFTYYRTQNIISSPNHPTSITLINESPFLLVPTDFSYYIYNLQDLKLRFMGPNYNSISSILFDSHNVFVVDHNILYRSVRGDNTNSFPLNTKGKIINFLKFGEYLIFTSDKNELLVYRFSDNSKPTGILNFDDKEDTIIIKNTINQPKQEKLNIDSKLEEKKSIIENEENSNKLDEIFESDCNLDFLYSKALDSPVSHIYHPHTYTNKILIVYEDGRVELFNINSKKTIYTFNFEMKITYICQTEVLDAIGFALEDGSVHVYNVKSDKLMIKLTNFSIKTGIISMIDFIDSYMLIIKDGCLILFDLELKKELFVKKNVLHGKLINNQAFLCIFHNSIEMYTIDDLCLLKKRNTMRDTIIGLENMSGNNLLLVGNDRVFNMNIYKDEQNDYIKCNHLIQKLSVDESIVMFGEKKISISRDGKTRFFINKNCKFVKAFKDYVLFGNQKSFFILNEKSKNVLLSHSINNEVISGDFDNERIVILDSSKLFIYDYNKEPVKSYSLKEKLNIECSEIVDIRIIHGLIFLKSENEVFLLNEDDFRRFKADEFAFDVRKKILACTISGKLLLYDLLSGNIVEEVEADRKLKYVAVLDNMKFIAVTDEYNDLHLLSNNSHFTSYNKRPGSKHTRFISKNYSFKPLESDFIKELMLYKSSINTSDKEYVIKGLNKEEVNALIDLIEKNFDKDFNIILSILNSLLQFKSKLIDSDKIKNLYEKITVKFREYENNVLKGIGYLKLSKNRLI